MALHYPIKVVRFFEAGKLDPKKELRRLYREEGLSLHSISRLTGIKKNTIHRAIEYFRIKTRNRGGNNSIPDKLLKAIVDNHFLGSLAHFRNTVSIHGWNPIRKLGPYPLTDSILEKWARQYKIRIATGKKEAGKGDV